MRFKLNKAKPNVIRGQSPNNIKPGSKESFHPQPLKDQISLIRDNSQRKDNWNLFVGDQRYKTNFFLRFIDELTRRIYAKQILPPAFYSLRLLIISYFIYNTFITKTTFSQGYSQIFFTIFEALLTIISIGGTFKKAQQLNIHLRRTIILAQPYYMSLQAISCYKGSDIFLISLAFYVVPLYAQLMVLSEWTEYLIHSIFHTAIAFGFHYLFGYITDDEIGNMAIEFTKSLIIATFVFSLFEKIKKQSFVVGFTNAKTKKILLSLINNLPYPIVLVTAKGQVLFCNIQFEEMLKHRLGIRQIPQNVFKLATDDETSLKKLQALIEETSKPTNTTYNTMSNSILSFCERKGKIEIRLKKKISRSESQQRNNFRKKEMEETKTMIDRNFNQKELFDKFEMVELSADAVAYQSKKAIMLTFNIVSEQRAKNKLLYMHSELTLRFLNQFNKKLQQLYIKQEQDEALANSVIEFLGTTYLALNRIQQIQHEFSDVNDSQKAPHENFSLQGEVLHCVESLSIKCLNQSAVLKLDNNKLKQLPEELSGDVQKFRLALQSVVEFATKYCMTGEIEVNIVFDGMTENKQYLISFDFLFNRNPNYNEAPLIQLLNGFSKNSKLSIEEIMLQNYEEFFDLIYHFGIGMIIFPSLVFSLDGTYQLSIIEPKDNTETMELDPQPQSIRGKVKINFKIPFSNAEMTKKVISPYFKFNPYKEETNGKSIYKSPLLKSREHRQLQMIQMKAIMEQSKSPLITPSGIIAQQRLQGQDSQASMISGVNIMGAVNRLQAQESQFIAFGQQDSVAIAQPLPISNLGKDKEGNDDINSDIGGASGGVLSHHHPSQHMISQFNPKYNMTNQKAKEPTQISNIKSEANIAGYQSARKLPEVKNVQKQLIGIEQNHNQQSYFRNRRVTACQMDLQQSNLIKKSDKDIISVMMNGKHSAKILTQDNIAVNHVKKNRFAQEQALKDEDEDEIVKNIQSQGCKIYVLTISIVLKDPANQLINDGAMDSMRSRSNNYIPPIQNPNKPLGVNHHHHTLIHSQSLQQNQLQSHQIQQKARHRPTLRIHVNGLDEMDNPKINGHLKGGATIEQSANVKSYAAYKHRHSVIGQISQTPLLRKTENPLEEIKVDKTKKENPVIKKITIEVPKEDVIEERKLESSALINIAASFGEIAITNRKINLIQQEESKNSMRGISPIEVQRSDFVTDGRENFESDEILEEDSNYPINDIPLSKHIPKDVLYSPRHGASKNLLYKSPTKANSHAIDDRFEKSDNKSRQQRGNTIPLHDKGGVDNLIMSNWQYRPISEANNGNNKNMFDNEDEKESISFPYKRGRQTLLYQETLKSYDYQQRSQYCQKWDEDVAEWLRQQREQILLLGNGRGLLMQRDGIGIAQRVVTMIDTTRKYVLIAEDNDMVAQQVKASLETFDIVGIIAENGKIAVDKFLSFMKEGTLFEFILMDIIMPEMNGHEATQRIRQIEKEFSLPDHEKHFICGFSALVDESTYTNLLIFAIDSIKKSNESGMSDILKKPMSYETLSQLVSQNQRESSLIGGQTNYHSYADIPSKGDFDQNDLTILPRVQAHA